MIKNKVENILDSIKKEPSKIFGNELIFGVLVISSILILNYFVFSRRFFSGEYIFAGDTYIYWSFKYFILYSIKQFNSLPWWDPTSWGGYPLYYHFLSGWSNYLGPYYLPSLILFKILSLLTDMSINSYIIFHQTIYIVLLNMIAVYLISRELVSSRIAAILPVFVFSFSYFQLLNFHDFYAFEAMVAPLFYLFALIRLNNNRTKGNLILFLLFLGLFFASLQNGILMSAFYWSVIFTFLLLIFNISLIRDAYRLFLGLIKPLRGKIIGGLLILLIISGLTASWLPFHYNAGHILKYRGGTDGKNPMIYEEAGGITEDFRVPFATTESWTAVVSWLPFPEVHDVFLRFAWSNHDNRYIGLATLPLILTALLSCLRNRYIYVLFLTYFLCNAFIIYAVDNIVYKVLTDNSDIFRNITNMATIFPRGGPLLFLIFLAAIGLDRLLRSGSDTGSTDPDYIEVGYFFKKSLLLLSGTGIVLIAAGIINDSSSQFYWMRRTLFHMGIYLLMFTFICRILFMSDSKIVKTVLSLCLIALTFMDLNASTSAHIENRRNVPLEDYAQRIVYPFRELAARGMDIPDDSVFKPIFSEAERMFPENYQGLYHNAWWPNWSTKEWLTLATRETGEIFLPNWKPEIMPNGSKAGRMIRYPAFMLFRNGYYLPFMKIKELDTDRTIQRSQPLFYLHDEQLVNFKNADPREPVAWGYGIKEYTPNKVVIGIRSDKDGFLYFLDNYDRFWSAYVDGKKTKVHRANFTFKAIELPAGEHTVQWIYNPYPVKMVYGIFYLCMGMYLVYYFLNREQLKPENAPQKMD
ncbi:MAG: YfhO family protein [Nitrospirae bacterium]|nr:YfhO family protein [Nitrospirota bacterium]